MALMLTICRKRTCVGVNGTSIYLSRLNAFCVRSYTAKCVEAIGCPREKIQVQHLRVSVNEIIFIPAAWFPSEPLRVLIAASFQEKKGIHKSLKALVENNGMWKEKYASLVMLTMKGGAKSKKRESWLLLRRNIFREKLE